MCSTGDFYSPMEPEAAMGLIVLKARIYSILNFTSSLLWNNLGPELWNLQEIKTFLETQCDLDDTRDGQDSNFKIRHSMKKQISVILKICLIVFAPVKTMKFWNVL